MSRRVDPVGDIEGIDYIDDIRRAYRGIRAPDRLRRRVHERLGEERPRRRLAPVATGVVAASLAVAILATLLPRAGIDEPEVRPTSLTVLSMAAGSRPDGPLPVLSSVRGMSLPAPPTRTPDTGATAPSPTDTRLEDLRNHSREEKENEYAKS